MEFCFKAADCRRSGIDLEPLAFFFGGERFGGSVRGRVGGDKLDAITAVGDECGVEAVSLFGELVLEQTPALFAVTLQVEGELEVVAVVVVRGPADGAGGAIFQGREWR